VLGAGEGNGKDAVDEVKGGIGKVCGGRGLNSDIEKADAMVELVGKRDRLAAH
jgi:hypothetical protein